MDEYLPSDVVVDPTSEARPRRRRSQHHFNPHAQELRRLRWQLRTIRTGLRAIAVQRMPESLRKQIQALLSRPKKGGKL